MLFVIVVSCGLKNMLFLLLVCWLVLVCEVYLSVSMVVNGNVEC